jgi:hypothetical protein
MKSRVEVAAFINAQLDGAIEREGEAKHFHHYGRFELRALMDLIYGGEPKSDDEKIKGNKWSVPKS